MAARNPGASPDIAVPCALCGAPQTIELEIVEFFLAAVARETPLLAREIHALASAYRWSFQEIAGLSRGQRHAQVRADRARTGGGWRGAVVSYIGRITGRMRGGREAPALLPAGRVASPLAYGDQRLHLIGAGGLGRGEGMAGAIGEDNPFASVAPLEGPAGPGAEVGRAGARGDAAAGQSVVPVQALPPGTGPRAAVTGEREASTAATDGGAASISAAAARAPAPASAQTAPGGRDPVQAPRALATAHGPSAPPVEARQRQVGQSEAGDAADGDGMTSALTDALQKVSRWMASGPRDRSAPTAPRTPASDASRVALRGAAGERGWSPRWSSCLRGRRGGGFPCRGPAPPPQRGSDRRSGRRSSRARRASCRRVRAPGAQHTQATPSGPSPAAYLRFGMRQR